MKFIKKIIDALTYPFVAWAVLLDESRRENLDGSWDKYWERKNRRAMKKKENLKNFNNKGD